MFESASWPTVNYIGRPPETREAILADLLQQILTGSLPPGGRLPTRPQLVRHYQTGMTTIQQVIDALVRDEFIIACGKRGTFVVDYPPHRHRFGLVLAQEQGDANRLSCFHTALLREAEQWNERNQANRLVVINDANGDLSGAALAQLCGEICRQRFAGLIFAAFPHRLASTPLLQAAHPLPRVMLGGDWPIAAAGRVDINQDNWFEQAFDHVASCGRRRVGILAASQPGKEQDGIALNQRMQRLGQLYGVEVLPQWIQRLHPMDDYACAQCTHLLFSLPFSQRPDALLISDDHLVAGADTGLQTSAGGEPIDVSVVAWANFPVIPKVVTPMTFLGFDTAALMQLAMDQLVQLQQNPQASLQAFLAPSFATMPQVERVESVES